MQINVPDNYGLVILTCGVLPLFTNIYMSGPVMKARDKLEIKYPNLYGVVSLYMYGYISRWEKATVCCTFVG